MSKRGSFKLALLPLAVTLGLGLGAPAGAMQHKPDCWKVPGHPDCLNQPYPGYRNSDLTANGRKAPSVPPPALANPWPTKQTQQTQ